MHRYRPQKITLGEARESQIEAVGLTCIALERRCFHHAEIPVSEAIARWGEYRRMDDLPVYCGKCRSPRFREDGEPNVYVTPVRARVGPAKGRPSPREPKAS